MLLWSQCKFPLVLFSQMIGLLSRGNTECNLMNICMFTLGSEMISVNNSLPSTWCQTLNLLILRTHCASHQLSIQTPCFKSSHRNWVKNEHVWIPKQLHLLARAVRFMLISDVDNLFVCAINWKYGKHSYLMDIVTAESGLVRACATITMEIL